MKCNLTWAVKGIACPCFVDWSHTVLSIVLGSGVITNPGSGLKSSTTGCTTRSEHSPVVEATIN